MEKLKYGVDMKAKQIIAEFKTSKLKNEIILNNNLNCYFNDMDYIHIYLIKSDNKKWIYNNMNIISYYGEKYQNLFYNHCNFFSNDKFNDNFVCVTPTKNKIIITRTNKLNFKKYFLIKDNGEIIKKKFNKIKIIIGKI